MRKLLFLCLLAAVGAFAQNVGVPTATPDWCKKLPRPEYAKLKRVRSADAWFEVYEVAPKVFAIYEPKQAEEVISYLIVGHERAILFDTGIGIGDIHRVATTLSKQPITVVNSHTHVDHVGGNWQFSDVAGMSTEFTDNNARGSSEAAKAEIDKENLCGGLPAGFDPEKYSTRPWKITQRIHDGSRFELGGRTLEVIATPGHTPDAIALLDRSNGLLFTGDSYYPGPIYLYRPETDYDAYSKSIERMAAFVPHLKMLLPAHNVPVADPQVLPRVRDAWQQVRAGKATASRNGENYEYKFDGFSFLVARKF